MTYGARKGAAVARDSITAKLGQSDRLLAGLTGGARAAEDHPGRGPHQAPLEPVVAPPRLTDRFLAAQALAMEIHGRQRRQGTEIPYLAHLLVVTGLVLEDGGNEDHAMAAMLHDAVEDGGGRDTLERIRRTCGGRVAAIVEGCSDAVDVDERESWIERKRRYLAHLPGVADDAVLRVALADKVHNARSIVRDYRHEGHVLWERFTQKTAREQLWYYGGLLAFFECRRPGPLTEDLRRAVDELAWLVAWDDAQRSPVVRLWVDEDLYHRAAPEGWVQVRTADQAIRILAAFRVSDVSFGGPSAAHEVIDWLEEQDAAGGEDRWPSGEIEFHRGPATTPGDDPLDAITATAGPRRLRR